MKLYYFTRDNGDGSASVGWCMEEHKAALLAKMEDDPETYSGNEGSLSSITLPVHITIEELGLSKWSFFDPKDDDDE
jgi:hypothetical protein